MEYITINNNIKLHTSTFLTYCTSGIAFLHYTYIFEFEYSLLLSLVLIPLIGILLILFVPKNNIYLLKLIGFLCFGYNFLFSLILWHDFDSLTNDFQFTYYFPWVDFFKALTNYQHFVLEWDKASLNNFEYVLGVDGISIFFIVLTTFLMPLCLLLSWENIKFKLKEYIIVLLLIELILINVFCILDIFFFYIAFESILIPMFLLIGIWGARERKIHAAYQFFIYTLFGSVLMLLAIIWLYINIGSTSIYVLRDIEFLESIEIILWLAFFASFAVKIPLVPVHIWLPEAHVEAPTAGSVILAGVLLKLGGYGLLRFSLPMFPFATTYFMPLVYTISLIGIIYVSCTTIRQIDLKKVIAYSSVAHMSFVTLGMFANNIQGIEGSIFLMLSHGIVSSALFICIGIIYDRYHTRIIRYYGGLTYVMPVYSIIFLIFTLANISFPTTSSFIGEFLVLIGIFQINKLVAFLASIGIILGAVYAFWLYNRVMFGRLKSEYLLKYSDLSYREFFVLIPFVFCVFFMGIYPEAFLNIISFSSASLLEYSIY
jgi:proton-translocating NADH-quinone oxidoreductase chain M